MKKNPNHWDNVREELLPKFLAAGINCCELKWSGCKLYAFRTFAHSLRRVDIDTYRAKGDIEQYEKKMREVIWACQPCHAKLDANKKEVTYEIVNETIAKRKQSVE